MNKKFIMFLLAVTFNSSAAESHLTKPKLVLQITVDQLRGDLLSRYYDRLGKGGLRYLMDTGTHYTNAHHRHANNETIVGHTTLATGADPAIHGMVANVWLDRPSGELTYNVEDDRYPVLSKGAGINKKTEIDSTLKAARSDGRSPTRILVSTFSDELMIAHGGKSKVFAVSVKDRGAISMAGHTGKAFWFSKQSGEFITSQFYYDQYPKWVDSWNAQKPVNKYSGTSWSLLHEKSSYMFAENDDRAFETVLPGFGRVFPHYYGKPSDKYFTTLLTVSPAGDELTIDFAKALISNENIGKDDISDYLAISLSSTDYVGHLFGPSSLESEDNILRLDKTIADLLTFVDEKVGLDNTLIVLSADHGAPESPAYLKQLGFETDFIHPEEFDKAGAIVNLKKRFGIGEELITTYSHPYIYLNRKVIAAKGLNQAEIERAVAKEVSSFEGVNLAVASSDLKEGRTPDTPLTQAILSNFNANRSGDIYVVFEANRFINDFDGLKVASSHGSPWSYDSHVPIIFAGKGVAAQKVTRLVNTVSVAPTLSQIVDAKPPSGSFGEVLNEIIGSK